MWMIHISRVDMTQVNSINHNRNQHVTEDKQQLASTYSDSTITFLSNNRQKYSNNNNPATIDDLDLAYGLIELLVKSNYSLESLINTEPSELSHVLAIDQEIAAIICAAANKKNKEHRKTHS
jgi:hypothetical protein